MKHVDRTGLYIMVIITMFASCSNNDKLDQLDREIHKLDVSTSCKENTNADR